MTFSSSHELLRWSDIDSIVALMISFFEMAVRLTDIGESGIFRQTKLDRSLYLKSYTGIYQMMGKPSSPVSSMYSAGGIRRKKMEIWWEM